MGRLGRELCARAGATPSPPEGASARYDSWLNHVCAETLSPIERACAGGGAAAFSLFRELDSDLWALLLTRQYDVYPNIAAVLPDVPEPGLQEMWNGTSGAVLAAQSRGFYDKVKRQYATHSSRPLQESRVLDFGCGWGRLTRFFARDVEPGALCGCDPVQPILDVCRNSGVPADLRQCEFVPESLPFDQPFDLIYAFSVFTHLSERAHHACLDAIRRSIRPNGLLFVTIRPPGYLKLSERMRTQLATLKPDPHAALEQARYLFAPHPVQPLGAEAPEGEITYGETVITLPYIRERWTQQLDLLSVDLLLGDPYQVLLTLRRPPHDRS